MAASKEEFRELAPSASSLMESMRDLGYSLETAVADIIDNSITADASEVDVFCSFEGSEPAVAIVDNGKGMSSEELIQAMRHGSANPQSERSQKDLGRFGLGLKTASFSQGRKLTVISKTLDGVAGACWDLNLIAEKDLWVIKVLSDEEINNTHFVDQLEGTGTLVLWEDLDRLTEDHIGINRSKIIEDKIDILDKHLSLVFHRFLSGEVKGYKKLGLHINGHKVEPFDPFCRKFKSTTKLPQEIVKVDGHSILIQPYILPHHSKLSPKEHHYYETRSNFVSNQGAYIYRNGRLMAWGDWFRLIPKGEKTKLARVQIDFVNSLDSKWTIDIKKSRAVPPQEVKTRMRQIIDVIEARSVHVHKGRGQKLFNSVEEPLWERYADKGDISYDYNASHPLLNSLKTQLSKEANKALELYLEALISSLPKASIYSDYSASPKESDFRRTLERDDALNKLLELKEQCKEFSGSGESFRQIALSTQLFEKNLDLLDEFIEREY